MKARELIKAVQAAGWFEVRTTGSHKHFKHASQPGLVTIPVHGSADLKIGLVKSIERQSGIKLGKGS